MRGSRAFLREPVMKLLQTALASLGALLLGSVAMAADLAVGTETTIGYSGAYEEYTIPSGISTPAELQILLKGGDGGKRVVPGLCKMKGGRGAKVFARFPVGTGAGELRPGGRIRFVVGKDGDSNRSNNPVGAGGGGGTAVLYSTASSPRCDPAKDPSTSLGAAASTWVILAVAGGGGGAYASGICDGEDGTGGQASTSGTKGKGPTSSGGDGGNGGQSGGSHIDCFAGGSGGGAFTAGTLVDYDCSATDLMHVGGAGLCAGGSKGNDIDGPDGGFGYGGGGSGSKFTAADDHTGGGGGGGYSGGGGGETYGRGGGAGSFLNAGALAGSSKADGGKTKTPDPGYVTYVLGPPTSVVAICRDVTLDLGSDGTATLLATNVDGGSVFPAVTGYTPTHEFRIKKGSTPQFFAAVASLDYDCSELGDGFVRLYALLEDGKVINDLDSCVAPITVRDSRDFTLTDLPDVVVIADGDGCSATVSGLPVPSPQGLCAQTGVTLTYWGQRFPAVGPSTIIGLTDGELHSLDVAVGSATIDYSGESDGGGTSPATSYDIVVKSGQAPVARCHDVSLQLDATGHASISASQIDGTGGTPSVPSEEPCGTPVALSLDKSAFTCADVGANAVTLTVTQSAGLSSTCAATVTVGADSVDPSTPGCAAAVNDPPTITAPATIAVTEDTPTAVTGISFADVDAAPAAVSVTLTVGSGGLAATTGSGVTVGGTATALTLDGTVAAINSFLAGGGVTFTPVADSVANVTLGVLIDDLGHNGGGGAKTASQDVTLVLGPVNDPPTMTAAPSIGVTEDTASPLVGLVFADPDAGTEACAGEPVGAARLPGRGSNRRRHSRRLGRRPHPRGQPVRDQRPDRRRWPDLHDRFRRHRPRSADHRARRPGAHWLGGPAHRHGDGRPGGLAGQRPADDRRPLDAVVDRRVATSSPGPVVRRRRSRRARRTGHVGRRWRRAGLRGLCQPDHRSGPVPERRRITGYRDRRPHRERPAHRVDPGRVPRRAERGVRRGRGDLHRRSTRHLHPHGRDRRPGRRRRTAGEHRHDRPSGRRPTTGHRGADPGALGGTGAPRPPGLRGAPPAPLTGLVSNADFTMCGHGPASR